MKRTLWIWIGLLLVLVLGLTACSSGFWDEYRMTPGGFSTNGNG